MGTILDRALTSDGHDVVVLTRSPRGKRQVRWDGSTLGGWAQHIDGSDVVINLAGRSVSCRYTDENLDAMMRSRVESTRVVGDAIAGAARPPKLWLQMSTATIYAHRFDAANDEYGGLIGGSESGVPGYWAYSVEIARNWEAAQEQAATPDTRKVALRSAMVMSPDRGGVFDVLSRLARLGLGGSVAGGRQYVSWIHDQDFVRAVRFLVHRDDIAGAVNLAAPGPLPQREFMRDTACGLANASGSAGHDMDGRDRGFRDSVRHRIAVEEPSCGPWPADRCGIRVRLPGLADGSIRPSTTAQRSSHLGRITSLNRARARSWSKRVC